MPRRLLVGCALVIAFCLVSGDAATAQSAGNMLTFDGFDDTVFVYPAKTLDMAGDFTSRIRHNCPVEGDEGDAHAAR